ncbi:kinetochore-associated Ndc80 complex subunit [Martiniozyma asiatica (nom. inval.)]|nr:kinetochore-associated Ndc80 complex subunit [Martiniozyma asiatica]
MRPSALYHPVTKYKFPVLENIELVKLFTTMEFNITEIMIERPTTPFMHSLIDQILDKFLLISPNDLRAQRSQTQTGQEHTSLNLAPIIAQRIMYKFLLDCGIPDFSLRDIVKPESQRLRIILSAIVNYARFREERMLECENMLRGDIVGDFHELKNLNENLKFKIDKLNNSMGNINSKENLESELFKLKSEQEQLTSQHEKYKTQKSGLVNELENISAIYVQVERELEEVRPYVKESPEGIKELLRKMRESEKREKERLDQLKKKLADINISIASLELILTDFEGAIKRIDELQQESLRHNSYSEKFKLIKSQINDTQDEVNEFTRNITQVENQLKHGEERLIKMESFYKDKMNQFVSKMSNQQIEFKKLKEDQIADEIEISEKQSQISEWERQINNLTQIWDHECKDAVLVMNQLNGEINLYLEQMSAKIKDAFVLIGNGDSNGS